MKVLAKIPNCTRDEQSRQKDGADGACRVMIQGLYGRHLLGCRGSRRNGPFDYHPMQVRPEGLCMGQKRVQACRHGRTPQIDRGPSIRAKFGGCREGPSRRLKHGKKVDEEKASVCDNLRNRVRR